MTDEENDLEKEEKDDRKKGNRKTCLTIVGTLVPVIVALIAIIPPLLENRQAVVRQTAVAGIEPTIGFLQTQVAALQTPGTISTPSTPNGVYPGVVTGTLTDRRNAVLPDMIVSIEGGPQTTTDSAGNFMLENVPGGAQRVIVQAPTTSARFTQNIFVEEGHVTTVNLVYDTGTMQLGILSITSPVDNSTLDVAPGGPHQQMITGRCDGLAQIYGSYQAFNIWVLVRAIQDDSRLWVQHPAALVDRNNNTWQTSIYMGDVTAPPTEGQRWVILAVATERDSGMENILNMSSLEDLPFSVIASNVVSLTVHLTAPTAAP